MTRSPIELQGGTTHQIRIGSSDIVLRDHLPELLLAVRKKFPQLKVTLREGYQPELEALLQRQEIDLAVTLTEKKPPPGMHSETLLELPLILLVPAQSPLTSAEELWKRDKIEEPLICLPADRGHLQKLPTGLDAAGN